MEDVIKALKFFPRGSGALAILPENRFTDLSLRLNKEKWRYFSRCYCQHFSETGHQVKLRIIG